MKMMLADCRVNFRLRALSSGRTADISYSIRMELRDGLIVKYHFLENTFDVATAFRSGVSGC